MKDRIDNDAFSRLKKACANPLTGKPRCWYCDRDEGDDGTNGKPIVLERGHLISVHDNGSATVSNTTPICRPCNAHLQENLTEDKRPVGWFTRYVHLLASDSGFADVLVRRESEKPTSGNTSQQSESTENRQHINLQAVEFLPANKLLPDLVSPGTTAGRQGRIPTKREISVLEATRIAQALITRARNAGMLQPADFERGAIINVARNYGNVCFAVMSDAFIAAVQGATRPPEWHRFYKSAEGWLNEGCAELERAAARDAEGAQLERVKAEERVKDEQQGQQARRDLQWGQYIEALREPDTGDEFLESFGIEGEALATKSADALREAKVRRYNELKGEKQKLQRRLAQCAEKASAYDKKSRKAYAKVIRGLLADIDDAKTIAGLVTVDIGVAELEQQLDPNEPAADAFLTTT